MSKYKLISSLIIVLILNSEKFFSQNLVYNGSFEILSSCPNSESLIEIEKAIGWFNPTQGTPDLYNSCSIINNVPLNTNGNQFANDGNGYSGIYSYANQSMPITDAREYIQSQLISTLSPCSIYKLSFFISLTDEYKYAINSIGGFLGDSAIHKNDWYCFSYYEPQVNNPKSRMLSDKENWTKIEGKFLANGGEQYITLGNFDMDSEIDTLSTIPGLQGTGYSASYYYIDNVSLTLFADATVSAFAGNDTMVAPGDSIFIGQEVKGLNCTWRKLDGTFITDSISGIWVQPTIATTYVVEQNLCGTITYDTVVVNIGNVGLNENPVSSLEGGLGRVIIFPNPSNGAFEIQNPTKQELTFELKNGLGQLVYQEKIVGEKQKIELNLEKGIYFATFSSEKGRFEEKMIVH